MEKEVGMYVRTKWGIAKIREVEVVEEILGREVQLITVYYVDSCFQPIDETKCFKEDILKASYNIIELIEEKDLVEIEYYSLRYKERVTRLFEVSFKDGKYINLSNAKCEFMLINGEFNEQDKELMPIIKSIVTKEQFESCKYKVGE